MARINIEECWWTDPRRSKLVKLVGDENAADGMAVRMWRLAQEFWGRSRGLVPTEIFETLEANAKLIQAKLAEVRGEYVYVKGSSQYLDWHAERKEKAIENGQKGGKKSAQRPRNAKGQLLKCPSNSQAPSKQKPSTSKPSDSDSDSDSDSRSGSLGVANPPAEPPGPVEDPVVLNRKIWDAYSAAYFTRYGTEPVRDKIVNSQIKKIGERLGAEAPDVAAFYVKHDKGFYVSNLHKIGLLLTDVEALRTQWATGRKVTQKQAMQADDSSALREQLKRFGGTK
jgi:hypothetical protein